MPGWSFLGEAFASIIPKATFLEHFVGREEGQVRRIFEQLRLPIPGENSFLPGTEGGLIFHTDAGIVLRAERKHTRMPAHRLYEGIVSKLNLDYDIVKAHRNAIVPERIVHDHVLQPIASLETDHHMIEIAAALRLGVTPEDVGRMITALKTDGVHYWDGGSINPSDPLMQGIRRVIAGHDVGAFINPLFKQGENNAAYLPIRTERFPNGVPVVVDRMAVGWAPLRHDPKSLLNKFIGIVAPALNRRSAPLQDQLWRPLRSAFHEAWPNPREASDPGRMAAFWEKCGEMARTPLANGEYLLTPGWVEKVGDEGISKKSMASNAANRYRDQLSQHLQASDVGRQC